MVLLGSSLAYRGNREAGGNLRMSIQGLAEAREFDLGKQKVGASVRRPYLYNNEFGIP